MVTIERKMQMGGSSVKTMLTSFRAGSKKHYVEGNHK